jgi:hypothetical protein
MKERIEVNPNIHFGKPVPQQNLWLIFGSGSLPSV